MNKILDYIQTHRDDYIEQLKGFLAIPSISALPAARRRRAALRRVDASANCSRIGLQNVRLIETPGHPVVYGEWLGAPGAPDDPVLRPLRRAAGRPARAVGVAALRGDGPRRRASTRAASADDKGQVFMHFKAIEAHLKQTGALPVNIKVIIEGEEEVGSANLDDFIAANKDLLKADVVVISDSPMFDRDVPSICYGLRGLAYFQIDVRGTKHRPALRLVRRRRRQPGDGARADARADEGQGRPHQDPRLLRRRRGAAEARSAPSSRSCRSTRSGTARSSGAPKLVRRERLLDARAHVGAADVRGQRPAGRLHRRRRQDGASRPWRWPRSACGSCPTRIRRRSASSSRTT